MVSLVNFVFCFEVNMENVLMKRCLLFICLLCSTFKGYSQANAERIGIYDTINVIDGFKNIENRLDDIDLRIRDMERGQQGILRQLEFNDGYKVYFDSCFSVINKEIGYSRVYFSNALKTLAVDIVTSDDFSSLKKYFNYLYISLIFIVFVFLLSVCILLYVMYKRIIVVNNSIISLRSNTEAYNVDHQKFRDDFKSDFDCSLEKIIQSLNKSDEDENRHQQILETKIEELLAYIKELIPKNTQEVSSNSELIGEENELRIDHSFVLKVANEINKMHMNLLAIGENLTGSQNLTRSLNRIKDNIRSRGYEWIEYNGLSYDSGLVVHASFVEDESMPKGEMIIFRVDQPEIRFKGEVIQMATVQVKQNLS